ncbi:MAG: cell division protein SepF [Clostridia bacterium]|nr:cell division protein SepF [Clostridia bacterium]
MGLKDLGKILFPDAIAEDNYEDDFLAEEEQYAEEENKAARPASSSYASRGGANVSVASGSSIEMKVVTPKSYDTVTQIADLLLDKKTVLLNLENTNRETARRLIDFLSGVAYALHGDVQKVADNTYAITPSNVAVSKESIGTAGAGAPETENGGVNF